MRRNPRWPTRFTCLALIALLGQMPAGAREGFGLMTKKAAAVTRVSPPAVFLMRTKIQVKATSTNPKDNGVAERLQSQLESELISRDSRLTVEPNRPETLIEVAVLQNEANEKWENRRMMESRQVGKDAKGKPIFESYPVTVQFKVVTHAFATAYKVRDLVKGASLDADSVPFSFKGDFREGKGAPEIFSLEGSAINQVVDSIARRITPTRELIHVLVPKGSLEGLGSLAEAGQWNLYLEALEKRQPATKPADESYRLYALGTSYEALGYAADDPEVTLKYLEQASMYYGQAIGANPEEKYFSQEYESFMGNLVRGDRKIPPPLQRVQSALVSYRRLKDFQDNYESMLASKATEDAKSLEQGGGERMDNASVISMTQAGLERDIILKAIDSAARHQFDVSAKGLIELAEGKVDKKIILRIQEIASGKKITPAPPTKKKAGKGR